MSRFDVTLRDHLAYWAQRCRCLIGHHDTHGAHCLACGKKIR